MRNNTTLDKMAQLFMSDNVADIVHTAAVQTLNLKLSGKFHELQASHDKLSSNYENFILKYSDIIR